MENQPLVPSAFFVLGCISTSICPVAFYSPLGARSSLPQKKVVKNVTVDLIVRGRQDDV